MVQQLAARLRPQLEAVVKQNESAAGDTFVPGDFDQVQCHQALAAPLHVIGTALNLTEGRRHGTTCSPAVTLLELSCLLCCLERLSCGAQSSFDMTVQKVRQCVGLCRQPRGR